MILLLPLFGLLFFLLLSYKLLGGNIGWDDIIVVGVIFLVPVVVIIIAATIDKMKRK